MTFGTNSLSIPGGGSYIAKYQSNGNLNHFFPLNDANNNAVSIKCDEKDGVFFAGSAGNGVNNIDIDPSSNNFVISVSNSYISKYNSNCTTFNASIIENNNSLIANPLNSYYEWYRASDNLLVQSGWNNIFSSCGSGDFYVIVRQGDCFSQSNSLPMNNTTQNLILNVSNDTVCTNNWNFDITTEGICASSYTWYLNNLPVDDTSFVSFSTLEDGDLIYCEVIDIYNNHLYSDTFEIVLLPQSIALNYNHDSICTNLWEFNLELEGICPANYSWFINNELVGDLDTVIFTTLDNGDLIFCMVEDIYGIEYPSDTIEINSQNQNFTLNLVNDTMCSNVFIFSGVLDGICPNSLAWYLNSELIQSSDSLVLTTIQNGDIVYCITEDIFGNHYYSDTIEILTTIQNPTLHVETDTVCANSSVNLTFIYQGICINNISWFVNDVVVGTSDSITISFLDNEDIIYCIIEDVFGNLFYTDTTEINVFPQTALEIYQIQNTLIATSGFESYQWLDCQNNYISINGQNQLDFEGTISGEYAIMVSDMYGCIDTSECFLYESTISTEELEINKAIVYPNPAHDILKIKSSSHITSTEIFTIDGKKIDTPKSVNLNDYVELDITALSSGVYFVYVKIKGSSNKMIFVKT